MRPEAPKCRRNRAVSLLAGGELGRRRAVRVRRHIENCASCRLLQQDLSGLSQWVEDLGRLQDMAPEEFASVRLAVRARIRASGTATTTRGESRLRTAWPILAPLAGVVLMAAILLIDGEPQVPSVMAPTSGTDDGKIIHMSSLEDASTTLLTIQDAPDVVHRVAVSFQGPKFTNARIFEVNGERWIDPTPNPAPGQVIFYRVD